MNRSPIDTLFYQWALSDEDKSMPTIFEDISSMAPEDKVSSLLEVFAELVTRTVEHELAYITLVEQYVQRATDDETLSEAEVEEIVEAIEELEDVQAVKAESDSTAKMLDIFGRAFAKAVVA